MEKEGRGTRKSGRDSPHERGEHEENTGQADERDKIKGESAGRVTSSVKEVSKGFKVSFRVKVVGKSSPKLFLMDDSPDAENLVVVIGKKGDIEPPAVVFSYEGMEALVEPY
ncbi:hypothetical protein PIB30_080635 [Stylosanthes scabra]|uniref:Nucleoplasmin-like domain-containing protein n=1 Tax=Stylosanthes scabra TaxID=79078 RepID=A0ABU6VRT5_9FABA|nr:hypothetical protein [Stylosanthes scabra]